MQPKIISMLSWKPKEKDNYDGGALRAWIVFWEGASFIDSSMETRNIFQVNRTPPAYFFVALHRNQQ